jgi:hypothetical protein
MNGERRNWEGGSPDFQRQNDECHQARNLAGLNMLKANEKAAGRRKQSSGVAAEAGLGWLPLYEF